MKVHVPTKFQVLLKRSLIYRTFLTLEVIYIKCNQHTCTITYVSTFSVIESKNRLDKLWAHQDFKFDWNADITGIGSRSLNILEYV